MQEYCLASRFNGHGQTYAQQQTVFEFASKTTVPGSVNQNYLSYKSLLLDLTEKSQVPLIHSFVIFSENRQVQDSPT